MNRTSLVFAVVIAFCVGFGSGYWFHQNQATSAFPNFVTPSAAEATAAVRRLKVGVMTFTEATVVLGDCAPATMTAGVTCMTQVVLDKGSPPQNHPISFARVNGQWEVSLW